jgi:RNA polymerase sigma factor (sigma-70 family)
LPALGLRSPLLRAASDEKLIALTRRGRDDAFEALTERYRARLLGFCRHMLRSREDGEDVLQEVYIAALRAMRADNRPIQAKPWLYKIARNRCLNHLRRPVPIGVESMDAFERESGESAAEAVAGRERLREVVGDVHNLPETQRTALILREFDALSYQQIAAAMETTVPAVKSLLVRARMGLASAAEARALEAAQAVADAA